MQENNNESKEIIQSETSFALVMVKPHAIRESLDVAILDLFDHGNKYLEHMRIDPKMKGVFESSNIISYFYRDLRDSRYQRVLDILYHKEADKPYHKIILDEYTGPCLFILLSSKMNSDDYYEGLQMLKGKERLLTEDGEILKPGEGIRGVFISPRISLDLNKISEDDVRKITRNVIHVADKEEEAARALRVLLTSNELSDLCKKKLGLSKFLDKNAPISIV